MATVKPRLNRITIYECFTFRPLFCSYVLLCVRQFVLCRRNVMSGQAIRMAWSVRAWALVKLAKLDQAIRSAVLGILRDNARPD